jgi:hypothetical protein
MKLKHLYFAVFAAALAVTVRAQDVEEVEEGAVGWTPVAVSLASPVQLPWGHARWDVFGLDLGLFITDRPRYMALILPLPQFAPMIRSVLL